MRVRSVCRLVCGWFGGWLGWESRRDACHFGTVGGRDGDAVLHEGEDVAVGRTMGNGAPKVGNVEDGVMSALV